jgi:hypothetical protein
MKKLLFILSASLIILSCSKDDNSTSSNNSNLLGTWKQISEKYQGQEQISQCELDNNKLFFSTNSNVTETFGKQSSNGCEIESIMETYVVSNSTLTITSAEPNYVYEAKFNILENSSSTLKLKQTSVKQSTPSGNVQTENFPEAEQITTTYTKQ